MVYRRRKKFQSYRSPKGHGRGFKLVIVTTVAVAVVSALILGAVLGRRAKSDPYGEYERQSLLDFGGVAKPEADYEDFPIIIGKYADAQGVDRGGFKSAVRGIRETSAVVFDINNADGGVYFKSDGLAVNSLSEINPKEISSVLDDDERYGVACFTVTSIFGGSAEITKNAAFELSVLAEAVSYGVDEIMLFGLSSDEKMREYVTAYVSFVEAFAEDAIVVVVLSTEDINTSDAAKIISATKGYAQGYAIDMRGIENSLLPEEIEKSAYYITNYKARVVVRDAEGEEREEIEKILESYGVENYVFKR